ncbi:hypothetical protein FQA39_LY08871 [Lamprigera yunnana]|nr:hypothetical protein FQA39_LY08871 [Lamprigera yunnana]
MARLNEKSLEHSRKSDRNGVGGTVSVIRVVFQIFGFEKKRRDWCISKATRWDGLLLKISRESSCSKLVNIKIVGRKNTSDIDDTPVGSYSNEKETDETFKDTPSNQDRRLQVRSTSPSYITKAILKLYNIQSNFSTESEFDVWCRVWPSNLTVYFRNKKIPILRKN